MGLRDRGWVAGGEAHLVRRSLTEHSHYVAHTISVAATRGEDRGMLAGSGSESELGEMTWLKPRPGVPSHAWMHTWPFASRHDKVQKQRR
jgi:hypothetical protein